MILFKNDDGTRRVKTHDGWETLGRHLGDVTEKV